MYCKAKQFQKHNVLHSIVIVKRCPETEEESVNNLYYKST